MSRTNRAQRFPNHAQLTEFVASILPVHPTDVPFTYHSPRGRSYDPVRATVSHVVLSITPTSGVYGKLQELADSNRRRPVSFLHRPFGLDRRAVPRGTLVLASHKRFDERLTVGYNIPLASALTLSVDRHVILQGYKDDAERLMGIAAPLKHEQDLASVQKLIHGMFGVCDLHHEQQENPLSIRAIAIVNAFNPEMVERVATAVQREGWVNDASDLKRVLYLTGQVRESGLDAATAFGMPVACVGHRAAEEWGVRHLAAQLRHRFPSLEVSEVYEDEESSKGQSTPATAAVGEENQASKVLPP